jgi:hypothetical protein
VSMLESCRVSTGKCLVVPLTACTYISRVTSLCASPLTAEVTAEVSNGLWFSSCSCDIGISGMDSKCPKFGSKGGREGTERTGSALVAMNACVIGSGETICRNDEDADSGETERHPLL